MEIFALESGPVLTMSYIVWEASSKEAFVVDVPPDSCLGILQKCEENQIVIKSIFLTHSHWDHTADAPKLKRLTDASVYIHPQDEYRIINPDENTIWKLPFQLDKMKADFYMNDGDSFNCGGLKLDIIHTPGHTEGSVCIVLHEQKTVFTGDTLFCRSIGRTDLPGGDTNSIIESINSGLMSLPDDYRVFSGHGDETTIGMERKFNPFLRG